MKISTRKILDQLTHALESLGLQRQKRGRAMVALQDGMHYGIDLQAREWADGIVTVQIFAVFAWEPIERIVALGHGRKFRLSETFTMSKLLTPDEPFSFSESNSEDVNFLRFIEFCRTTVLPVARKLGDPKSVEEVHMKSILTRERPPRPDLLLAIRIHELGVSAGEAAYREIYNMIPDDTLKENFSAFWENLKGRLT